MRTQNSRGTRGQDFSWLFAPPDVQDLLFESQVSDVRLVNAHNAVVLLEQALLLGLATPLQTLDQQAVGPVGAGEWRRWMDVRHRRTGYSANTLRTMW